MPMNVFLKATVACLFLHLACHAYARQLYGTGPADLNAGRLKSEIRRIIRNADADVGVTLIADSPVSGKLGANAGSGRKRRPYIIRINDFRMYPLMSVMKMHQALWVTDSLSRSGFSLDTGIAVADGDLKRDTYSPLRDSLLSDRNKRSWKVPVRTLLRYTLQLSDNNACDILFRHFGGPSATDRYIRSLGIEGFGIAVTEDQMHKDTGLCGANWSRPSSAAGLLRLMVTAGYAESGNELPGGASRKLSENRHLGFVLQTMMTCTTGQDRLAAPLSGTGAAIGHKTGTGDKDSHGRIIGLNDAGFIILPDGRYYTLAVFVRNSRETPAATARIIADISEAVYRHMTWNGKPE